MQRHLVLWLRNNIGLLALLLISFLIYAPSLSGDFVIDDVPTIKNNPYLSDIRHIPGFFTKGVWESTELEINTVPIYRPMHLLVELLNHAMWGSNPLGYHVFLLLLHLANTCLIYILIRKFPGNSAMAAIIGAALFALHPTRVESVAWLSGITDPLAVFFLLGALLAHQSFTANPNDKREWRYLVLSLFCFQMALWSKEVAIVFPLVAVVHDLLYRNKINWPTAMAHVLLVVCYLVARNHVLGATGKLEVIDVSQFPKALDFALGYIELIVFPAQIPYYLQPPEHSVSSALGVAGAIVIAMLAGFSWRVFDAGKRKAFTFSVCWMVVFLWPAILLAFYTKGYYSARFLYVPAVGAAVFVAVLYDHMNAAYPHLKTALMASCALVVASYGFITWKEIPAWRDDGAIYGKIARLAPESPSGFNGLGKYYMMREDYAAAEKNFLVALKNAKFPQERVETLVALGTIQGMANKLAMSEHYLREAVQIDPNNSEAWAGLGNLAWMQGKIHEAISCYEKAISIQPKNYEAAMNLAMAYEKSGQPERGALIRQRANAIRR